jgi:hypothetical protein
MEEDHAERIRQLRQEAADRIEELTASRDALGIVKEQERLAQAETEENRSFQREQARARKETEQRIRDLDAQYIEERARRQAQFEQDLRDNEAKRVEELARAAEAYQQELRQAQEARAQRLRDLQEGLNEERLRRREVFLEQIRDLDSSLLGERALRNRYYQDMLRDAEAFFAQYRAALPSASSLGTSTGTIGTKTQDSLLSATVAAAVAGSMTQIIRGDSRVINYQDQRRLEYPLSKDAKADYERTARNVLKQSLGVT